MLFILTCNKTTI